jgi:hypothetical protein
MKMKLPNGTLAQNNKENADVFDLHFQQSFNRDTPQFQHPIDTQQDTKESDNE